MLTGVVWCDHTCSAEWECCVFRTRAAVKSCNAIHVDSARSTSRLLDIWFRVNFWLLWIQMPFACCQILWPPPFANRTFYGVETHSLGSCHIEWLQFSSSLWTEFSYLGGAFYHEAHLPQCLCKISVEVTLSHRCISPGVKVLQTLESRIFGAPDHELASGSNDFFSNNESRNRKFMGPDRVDPWLSWALSA